MGSSKSKYLTPRLYCYSNKIMRALFQSASGHSVSIVEKYHSECV